MSDPDNLVASCAMANSSEPMVDHNIIAQHKARRKRMAYPSKRVPEALTDDAPDELSFTILKGAKAVVG
jgi:hypothetical protein